jgi:hypothetical protein
MVRYSWAAANFRKVGGLVDVEVVPDQDDWAAELLVCCDQQVPVVAPGKALRLVAVAVVAATPVGRLRAVTWFLRLPKGRWPWLVDPLTEGP